MDKSSIVGVENSIFLNWSLRQMSIFFLFIIFFLYFRLTSEILIKRN